ncbi:MAG: hypothetical protein U0K36_09495 [Bacteroidales bacterium]|nr:hypothetical protein [Bacteroidales bacterium]
MATKSLMTQIGEVLAGRLKTLADKIASTASEALASAKPTPTRRLRTSSTPPPRPSTLSARLPMPLKTIKTP